MWGTPIRRDSRLPPLFLWPLALVAHSSWPHARSSRPARRLYLLYDEEIQRIDQFTSDLIRRKSLQLVDLASLTAQDQADIEQTLLAWIQEREPDFDKNRAHWKRFVTCLVDYAIANLLRERRAQKRGPQSVPSLHELLGEAGEKGLGDAKSECQQDARLGRRKRTAEELAQLKSGVAEAIKRLPPELRPLAELGERKAPAKRAERTPLPSAAPPPLRRRSAAASRRQPPPAAASRRRQPPPPAAAASRRQPTRRLTTRRLTTFATPAVCPPCCGCT